MSSQAWEREQQNDRLLDELSSKVTALRGVTIDIYDNARDHTLIESTSDTFSSLGTTIKGSAGRLTRMAQSGNKVAVLKLAGIVVGVALMLYWGFRLIF
ncbi:hypothetical protein PMIN06_004067 [Paraphaeosphaeria minitans]|uniref:Blocked early in transport 1 n=1 Tax=Paraphaeosphaeria minitans TaxID=565426 RepID=A0A9P6KJE8_9PLEO|nr:blocked early in transport 1 [Paraphaeosphaeria minitans]